jgi:general secretion pathway protein K
MNKRPRGLVLVAVLWLVAAVSMIATGMMQVVKNEANVTGRMRDSVTASAWGEAAMQVALQAIAASGKTPDRAMQEQVSYAGVSMLVRAAPLNGYIDINKAPVELLAQMLQTAGGLAQPQANQLAQAIVDVRSKPGPGGKVGLFETAEDLMQVAGVDYPLYAEISRLVTTDSRGSGRVNPLAAPLQVLRVLSAGNDAAVAHFAAGRDAGQPGVDQSFMNGAWLDAAGSSALELEALVPLMDGSTIRVQRRYTLGKSNDGLPWRVFSAETTSVSVSKD